MAKTKKIEGGEESIPKSISFSKTVLEWAQELAKKKGYGTNFSGYIQDLIRRDRDRERELGSSVDNLSVEALEAALSKKKKK